MRKRTTALAGLVAAGLTACSGGDSASAEDTVKEFAAAAAAHDYAKVCSMLDPDYVSTAEQAEGVSCEESIKGAAQDSGDDGLIGDPDALEVGDAEVSDDGQSATVPTTYKGRTSQVRLAKVDDEWKVAFGL